MNTAAKPVKMELQGRVIHYICPKCKRPLEFTRLYHGKSLCRKCGQRLDWSPADNLYFETVQALDSDEAAWIAKEYYKANEMKEEDWIDITEMRNSLRGQGALLYLVFGNKKNHGKFMRSYAKEGIIHDG